MNAYHTGQVVGVKATWAWEICLSAHNTNLFRSYTVKNSGCNLGVIISGCTR